jgi:hypothetical protein
LDLSSRLGIASPVEVGKEGGNKKWDVVLLGGAIGSIFSFCQCLISPFLGARESHRMALRSIVPWVWAVSKADHDFSHYCPPHIHPVSDKYGRKPVLLATMIGNIISAGIWLGSTSFASRRLRGSAGYIY